MIETKVPKDIRNYKTKIIGNLSFRQIICVAIAVIVDIILYFSLFKYVNLSPKVIIYIIILIDVPILAFIAEPYGMSMEVFLKTVIVKNFIWPTKRKYKTKLKDKKKITMTDKEKKIHNREFQRKLKLYPEYKAYK